MKGQKVLHSSASDEWATPQEFVDALERRIQLRFVLDPCASKENKKARRYFTEAEDGLKQDWGRDLFFCNPPYSAVGDWVRKASTGWGFCLVPARTDTKWFHEAVKEAGQVIFLKGRLKFGDQKNSAPFPSCVIGFGSYGPRVSFEDWKKW